MRAHLSSLWTPAAPRRWTQPIALLGTLTLLVGLLVTSVASAPTAGAAVGDGWVQRATANAPSGRRNHAMAYDAARQQVVLFGGGDQGQYNDTWVYDGTNWTQKTPAHAPGPRAGSVMVYDAARQKVVLFGGAGWPSWTSLNDTWEWDGTDWTQKTPPVSPGTRYLHAMAYDAVRHVVVLFGGVRWDYGELDDTWEWNGTTWAQRSPVTSPSPRYSPAMAYDAARGTTVLFGGFGGTWQSDTWLWDGTSWTQVAPATSPPARAAHMMDFDLRTQRTLLYGGHANNQVGLYDDTWEWDGTTWAQRIVATSPGWRYGHGLAYDAHRRTIVVFGGIGAAYHADTWELLPATVEVMTSSVSVPEGDVGATDAVVTVGVSFPVPVEVEVTFHTVSTGSAVSPDDFVGTASGTVTIPANAGSAQVRVPVVGDVLIEGPESFGVVLDSVTPVAAVLGTATSATVSITDDDATAITITDEMVTESSGPAVVRAVLDKPFAAYDLTVRVATQDDTAVAGSDYVPAAAELQIPAGATESADLPVTILGDLLFEYPESFAVAITSYEGAGELTGPRLDPPPTDGLPPGWVTGTTNGTVSITDDDPTPIVSIGSLTMLEGDSGSTLVSFPVSIRHPAAWPVELWWNTADGTATAGSDYTHASGKVVFASGDTHKSAEVFLLGDTVVEPNETFTVTLSSIPPAFEVAQRSAVGAILNDDGPRSLSVLDTEVAEGGGPAQLTVALSDPLAVPLTVSYATANGTAVAGADYTTSSGSVSIPAGLTTATIEIAVAADPLVEPDETFLVTVTVPPSLLVTVTRATATATIRNDDTSTLSMVQVTPNPVTEGATGVNPPVKYAITLSAPVSNSVIVAWATDETDPVEAMSGIDFAARSGTRTFVPGQTVQYLYGTIRGDGLHEADEGFVATVTLVSDVRGVTHGTVAAATTIRDDDPAPRIFVGSVSLTEGNTGTKLMAFPVTLGTPSGATVTATFATSDDTATAGSDYEAVTDTITFLPGDRTEIAYVPVLGDTTAEPNEKLTVRLADLSGATAGALVAKGTIINDDAPPPTALVVTIKDLSVTEGNSGLKRVYVSVSLNRANDLGLPVSVGFTTADGSARASTGDYVARSGTVTFAAGVRSKAIYIDVRGDTAKEPNEAFTVQLRSPSAGLVLAAKSAGIVTITNDD